MAATALELAAAGLTLLGLVGACACRLRRPQGRRASAMALAVEEPSEDRGGRDDGGEEEEEDDEDEEAVEEEEEATEEEVEDSDEEEVVEDAKSNEARTGRVGMEEGLEMGLLGELD